MRGTSIRVLTLGLAFAHALPAQKHLAAFFDAPSLTEAWKGLGAALAVALYLLPPRVQARGLGHLWARRRSALTLAGVLLALIHVVPMVDHLPGVLDHPTWADAWRGGGATVAALWFLLPLPVQKRALLWATTKFRFALTANGSAAP